MLQIKTTGVEDYLDGSANIKALIIGGPGGGKTRSASFWPAPIFLDCENGRGSLADRKAAYVEIKSSKDMLDALEYLKSQERTPKAQRNHQTVVVDTVDSFQRVVKDEWVQLTKAQTFSGFDAWGYLDTKMQMLFTRLLNLDYNVLVNSHYEDKMVGEGDEKKREYSLQLQGKIKDHIFNDFGLVGWLGTYWEAVEGQRVQKRGLTFQPTPEKPFLKDRFNVTPKWLEITFTDDDYQQLFEAFFNRPEFEQLSESEVLGEIPDAKADIQIPGANPAVAPSEGGALPPAPEVETPLEKKTKGELEEVARGLGITFKGNTLKGELLNMIKEAQAKPVEEKPAAGDTPPPAEPEVDKTTGEITGDGSGEALPDVERSRGFIPQDELRDRVDQVKADAIADPTPSGSEDSSPASTETETPAHVSSASPEQSSPTARSGGDSTDEAQPMGLDAVAEALGAEVIEDSAADTPTPQPAPQPTPVTTPNAPRGPSACADCGKDLGEEWNDPSKRDYIRLSFVKHRKYLCTGCLNNPATTK